MLILKENNCISTASGIVTLFRWLFSTQFTNLCIMLVKNFYQSLNSLFTNPVNIPANQKEPYVVRICKISLVQKQLRRGMSVFECCRFAEAVCIMVGGIAASKHQVHALLNSRQQKHRTDRQTKRARYQTVGLYRGVDSSYVSRGFSISLF